MANIESARHSRANSPGPLRRDNDDIEMQRNASRRLSNIISKALRENQQAKSQRTLWYKLASLVLTVTLLIGSYRIAMRSDDAGTPAPGGISPEAEIPAESQAQQETGQEPEQELEVGASDDEPIQPKNETPAAKRQRGGKPKPFVLPRQAAERQDIQRPKEQIDISKPETITTAPEEWGFFDMKVLETYIDRRRHMDHTMTLTMRADRVFCVNLPYIDGRQIEMYWEEGTYKPVGYVNGGFIYEKDADSGKARAYVFLVKNSRGRKVWVNTIEGYCENRYGKYRYSRAVRSGMRYPPSDGWKQGKSHGEDVFESKDSWKVTINFMKGRTN